MVGKPGGGFLKQSAFSVMEPDIAPNTGELETQTLTNFHWGSLVLKKQGEWRVTQEDIAERAHQCPHRDKWVVQGGSVWGCRGCELHQAGS